MLREVPEAERRVEMLAKAFFAMYNANEGRGWLRHVKKDGKVAGVSLTYPPQAPPPSPEALEKLGEELIRIGGPVVVARYQEMSSVFPPPTEPHIHPSQIGVDTLLQGQGHGSTLLDDIVREADERGIGAYLNTFNLKNLSLYERFGFQIIAQKEVIGVQAWGMWRPPTADNQDPSVGGSKPTSETEPPDIEG